MANVGPPVVLPSPWLGEWAYAGLASALGGWVAPLPPTIRAEIVLRGWVEAVAARSPGLIVAHSNAGFYAPAVAEATGVPIMFVDAALPSAGVSTPVVPPELADGLRDRVDGEGLLPRWPMWWAREEVEPLFPGPDVYEQACRAAPRVPAPYVTDEVPVPKGWAAREGLAYLAFGRTYAAEIATAEQLGWPVLVLPEQNHLLHLHNPAHVAAEVQRLASGR